MRRLAFTASAERELEAIGDYIALENPARAGSFVRELRKDCALLTAMPERHPCFLVIGIRESAVASTAAI